jgi:imidazolonepropionase-like amidohydrolase
MSQPRFNSFMPTTTETLQYSDVVLMDAIIDEAHSLGLQAHVHAPTLANAKEVLRAGADGLAHSAAGAPIDDEFVLLMRKNQAAFTTTLALLLVRGRVCLDAAMGAIDRHQVVAPDVYER